MLTIRLRRAGKRHQPTYRVVITEQTAPIQGKFLEVVGTYNPRARQFAVKEDRILYWLDHGAQPSERMAKLLTTTGMKHRLLALPDYDRKPKRSPKKKATEATEKTATQSTEAAKTTEEAATEGSNPEPASEEGTPEAEPTVEKTNE